MEAGRAAGPPLTFNTAQDNAAVTDRQRESTLFERTEIERAIDLQQRSYKLLLWMTDAVERGFITFKAAHTFSTLPEAARGWLDSHYESLPTQACPPREDLTAFANLFSTYLDNSFDLIEHPGQRLYSPDAHCFCPLCSWMVAMPRLQTKTLMRSDKERARKLTVSALRQLALELDVPLDASVAEAIADEPEMREQLALVAYGHDLLRRLGGIAEGPASLALWRRFAWTPQGSPKHGFELTAAAILDAEAEVVRRLKPEGA
jgi:hypothetical protein